MSYTRIIPGTTAEELTKNLVILRDEGLFREIGASETNAKSLEAMSKVAPVSVVEIEVSLWSYDQDVQDVLAWSERNKVPVFAYSPLGRGFLTRKWKTPDDIPDGQYQKYLPRFQGEAFYENLKLVDQLDELAAKKGLKTSQLALAWVSEINPYVRIRLAPLVLATDLRISPSRPHSTSNESRRTPRREVSNSLPKISRALTRPCPSLRSRVVVILTV